MTCKSEEEETLINEVKSKIIQNLRIEWKIQRKKKSAKIIASILRKKHYKSWCCCIDVFLVHWDRSEYNKNLLITTKVLYFNEKIALLCLKVIRLLVKCCKICISSSILRFYSIKHLAISIWYHENQYCDQYSNKLLSQILLL